MDSQTQVNSLWSYHYLYTQNRWWDGISATEGIRVKINLQKRRKESVGHLYILTVGGILPKILTQPFLLMLSNQLIIHSHLTRMCIILGNLFNLNVSKNLDYLIKRSYLKRWESFTWKLIPGLWSLDVSPVGATCYYFSIYIGLKGVVTHRLVSIELFWLVS